MQPPVHELMLFYLFYMLAGIRKDSLDSEQHLLVLRVVSRTPKQCLGTVHCYFFALFLAVVPYVLRLFGVRCPVP